MGIDHLKQKIQTNTNSGSLVNFSNFRIMAIGLQKNAILWDYFNTNDICINFKKTLKE